MAEAVIFEMIQKLESWAEVYMPILEKHSRKSVEPVKLILDDLIADFLRGKELGDCSRLNYFICDIVGMIQDIVELTEHNINMTLTNHVVYTRDWVREARMHMINLGVEGDYQTLVSEENVGVGDEDDEEEDVVGLEEDVQVLLRRAIFNEKRGLRTLLVKGMPGVGKTALARKIYNHMAVFGQFKHRAWVCLSSDLTCKEILMKIIQQVVANNERLQEDLLLEEMERADNQSLQQMLHQLLQGMPYFIVVDNLMKGMGYQRRSIYNCLPRGGKSRLMLTSRSEDHLDYLSIYLTSEPYTHEMKALDSDKGWQLFLKTINKFTSVEEQCKFPKHVEKKGKQMLAICGGLPVAIIDAGRQIAKQRLEKGVAWEELFEVDSIDLSASLSLLESSYRELDEELQECFIYVAFFKENAIIRAKKLEHIWVTSGGFTTDSATSFVLTLSRKSFVEIVDEEDYRIKKCCINPLLHKLSIKIAEKEMGFEILRNFDGNSNGANSQPGPCHRVIHCGRDKFDYSTNQDKHLLSLIFHGGGSYLEDANWKRLELLKLLDLEDFGLKFLSETMGTTLMELKYLGLRKNYIQEIPRSLGCLKKLEVLDIAQNFMVEVPDIIWEMSGLKHLHMSDVICPKPLKMDTLEHLETLAYVSISNVMGLEANTSLVRLGIEEVDENLDVSKLNASMDTLKNIRYLTLRGFRFRSMPCLNKVLIPFDLSGLKLDGLLPGLQGLYIFPLYFGALSLVNSCLDEDPMPMLQKLPSLKYLLLQNAYTGRQMAIDQDGFPDLLELHQRVVESERFKGCRNGEPRNLEISSCPYLDTLPEEIWSLKRLKEFKMVTTKKIATKIRKSSVIPKTMGVDISP